MKYLRIEDNNVYFTLDGTDWNSIDEINKEHLLMLLDLALSDEFEMDVFEKEKVGNKAHQIIYKNIFEKFSDLIKNRSRFKDESEALYKPAIEKYSQ